MNVALLTFSLKKRNETKRRKWMKSDKRRAQKLILYSEIYFFFRYENYTTQAGWKHTVSV